ncbi:MAG: hypothetical protein ACR2MU_02645 [Gaiellaceae bacterium]
MAVREQPEQDEFECLALADDGALDLGKDPLAADCDLLERERVY